MKLATLIVLILLPAITTFAEDKIIYGLVKDNLTQEVLFDVKVSIYSDTTLVAETATNRKYNVGNNNGGYWIAMIPAQGGMFHFIFQKEGYETVVKDFSIKPFKKIEQFRVAFNIDMQRKREDQALGGVTIKATRIKFYHKGDTLVYNADAFNLAEGSMLDNLIKSMPGAELSDDGEITINGKHVDALLLNGEDFFKGKNKIMLENLPAYMVKDVKVYDRVEALQKAMGRRDGDYVLDVNLKKQYSIGWIGNAEIGVGSENRYLARLFAMRFTDASRIGVYANFNNLNDTRKPGENSNWTPETMPTGLLAQKMGGIDYLIKPKRSNKKFSGNAEVKYTDADNYSESTTENFLTEGNTFERSRVKSRRDNISFSTSHLWQLTHGDGVSGLEIRPSFDYNRYNRYGNNLGATFAEAPYAYADSRSLLDSIQTMQGAGLRRIMINRYLRESKYNGWKTNSSLGVQAIKYKVGLAYFIAGGIEYTAQKDITFNQYHLQYPALPQTSSLFQNTYTHDHPNSKLEYTLSPGLHLSFSKNMSMMTRVELGQSMRRRNYSRNNLDALQEWAEGTGHRLGELPSEVEYMLQTLDMQNSYDLRDYDNYQGVNINCWYNYFPIKNEDGQYWASINLTLPLTHHHYRLDYTRGSVYSGISRRNTVLFEPDLSALYMWNEQKQCVEFKYNLAQAAPDMTNFIEIDNTIDPLNIYTGNASLKNSSKHSMSFLYKANNYKKETTFSTNLAYNTTVNAIAYAYTYDRTTGIRYYKPQNINGNYLLSATLNYSSPFDKRKKLTINTVTYLKLDHGVDLISEDANLAPVRSSVSTWWGTETLKLNYKLGKHSLGAKAYVGVGHVASSRADFDSFTLYDFNYGLTALIQLPAAFQFSTDLTMYSHRGYATSNANTNDLVWNARLSKTFTKSGITLALDGFDILGNLSNIYQVLNSQGRTETYRNSLPRYVMAHVIYRFNKKPKKQ